MARQVAGEELVVMRTRVPLTVVVAFAEVAARNQRSVAAEMRVAIDRHLQTEAPERDGGSE